MINKTIIKLVSLGAAVLFICSLSASADPTEEKQPAIQTVSVNTEEITRTNEELPLNHDASMGERGDVEDLPLPENDELIIAPNPNDQENLVAPNPGADGDVFILETGAEAQETQTKEQPTIPLIGFPVFVACVFLGLLGVVFIYGKRQG